VTTYGRPERGDGDEGFARGWHYCSEIFLDGKINFLASYKRGNAERCCYHTTNVPGARGVGSLALVTSRKEMAVKKGNDTSSSQVQ